MTRWARSRASGKRTPKRVPPAWPGFPVVEELRIEVPGYMPPRGTNAERRMHYHAKEKLLDLAMDRLAVALILGGGRRCVEGPLEAHWTVYANRLLDWSNLSASFKIPEDALRYLGVIEDDRPAIVRRFVPHQVQVPEGHEGLLVVLRHLDSEEAPELPRWRPRPGKRAG